MAEVPAPIELPITVPTPERRSGTVLIIDDDDAIRRLYKKKLRCAGYDVIDASGGHAGFAAARIARVDVVLVDMMMPDVDGWGVLASFKNDVWLAEHKVICMSASPMTLADLQQGRVTADAWYVKAGGREIVDVVDGVLARRRQLLSMLPAGLSGPLRDIGVQTLIDGICAVRLRGVLRVDDGASCFDLAFDDGVIASAAVRSAVVGEVIDVDDAIDDREALLRLLELRDGQFAFEPCDAPPRRRLGQTWHAIARGLCDELNGRHARVLSSLLSLSRSVAVDDERLQLWRRHASRLARSIADRIAAGTPPREIIADEGASPVIVDEVVSDLLRRGVVRP